MLGDFFDLGANRPSPEQLFRLSSTRSLGHHITRDFELSVRINDKPVGVERLERVVTLDLLRSDGHGFSRADRLNDRSTGFSRAPTIHRLLHLLSGDLAATKQQQCMACHLVYPIIAATHQLPKYGGVIRAKHDLSR